MGPPHKKKHATAQQNNQLGASQRLEEAPLVRENGQHNLFPLVNGATVSDLVFGIGENTMNQSNTKNAANCMGNGEVSGSLGRPQNSDILAIVEE